jgi:hypothetical protein
VLILPVAAVVWIGWRARGSPRGRLALGAFAASLAWCLVSLMKPGSSSNYWMEPAASAVALVAHAPLPAVGPVTTRLVRAAMLAAAVWVAVFSVHGVAEAFAREPARAALVEDARRLCGARASDVVIATSPGIELRANGRVVVPAFQFVFLAREGRFPVATWLGDVRRPEVACLVTEGDLGVFSLVPDLARALDETFEIAAEREAWRVYRRRPAP